MRTTRAYCIELQRTVSIADVQAAYFAQPEPRQRYTFLCADPVCRERAAARLAAFHEDRLFFDDAFPTSPHFATVPQTLHDPWCEDVLREKAAQRVRDDIGRARDDLNASRRFSTKQAFEVYDVYWPAVAGVLPLSSMLAASADVDPRDPARSVMDAPLGAAPVPTSARGEGTREVPVHDEGGQAAGAQGQSEATVPPAADSSAEGSSPREAPAAMPLSAGSMQFASDDEAIRALERAIEAMNRDDAAFDAAMGSLRAAAADPTGTTAPDIDAIVAPDAMTAREAAAAREMAAARDADLARDADVASDRGPSRASVVAHDTTTTRAATPARQATPPVTVGERAAEPRDAAGDRVQQSPADPTDDEMDRLAERLQSLVEDMRTRVVSTRRLADVVGCYSELGAVDRQKAQIRLPGCRAMPYGSFIQPLSRYQDSDEPLVRVGGARVMREERGYVLRFFDRIVLDGERYEVVMRISDARIAAAAMGPMLRAQLLASLGDGHHVRVFFFGGIAPDSKQNHLTQVRLSDLDNLVLQPMRVAGAGASHGSGAQFSRQTASSTGLSSSRA